MRTPVLLALAGFALAAMALAAMACGSHPSEAPISRSTPAEHDSPPPVGTGASVTVASYNINAGMSGDPATAKVLSGLKADIIVLQEVTSRWRRLLETLHQTTHPHRIFHIDHRHHYGGLAVLSRFPISGAKVLRNRPGPFVAWRGVVASPLGLVQLVNVHLFPPVVWFRERGIMQAYQDSQARHVKELESHWPAIAADIPTVIAGDFNENRNGSAIEWLIERGFAPAHEGMASTWRWKVRGQFEVTFQLDHLMLRGLKARDAVVTKAGASDHFPISARLSLVE